MKKFSLLVALIATLGFVDAVYAQLDATFNITSISSRNPQVGIEYAVSEQFGIGLDVGIPIGRYKIVINDSETTFKRAGFFATVQAKYYFNPDQSTTGFYGVLYSRYRNLTFTDREFDGTSDPIDDLKINRLAVGLGFGGKFLINDKFIIDAMLGGGFAPLKDNELIDFFEDDLGFLDGLQSIDLYMRVGLGYRILD